MTTSLSIPAALLERLEALLAEEARLLDLRRSQLASLSGAIVDRDEEAVERLLEQIERAQELQADTDGRLQALRGELAAAAGRPRAQMRLSALIGCLDGPAAEALGRQRARVIDLAGKLQQEHLRAVLLLNECARINRMLLASLMPHCQTVTTYSPDGTDDWRAGSGLLDAES